MKKLNQLFIGILCLCLQTCILNGQNTYDTYNCANDAVVNGVNLSFLPFPTSYDGEYQIWLDDNTSVGGLSNYWESFVSSHAIRYKIEAVSYPFTTNCFNCQATGSSTVSNDRILKMPDNTFTYNQNEKAWERDSTYLTGGLNPSLQPGFSYSFKLRREFSNDFNGYTDPSDLVSIGFVGNDLDPGFSSESHRTNKITYPHTILKHTFYIYSGLTSSTPVVDSFSFILDHTRGRMKYYPFSNSNSPSFGTSAANYDIAIFANILSSQQWEDPFDNFTLIGNPTINYFPLAPFPDNTCPNHIPDNYNLVNPSTNYIRPAPFSLVQSFLGSHLGAGPAGTPEGVGVQQTEHGIEHKYIIDKAIDLTLINPVEKIIYNPSLVDIDIPNYGILVFPSGYTFKTVGGIYPSVTDVNNADPNHLYSHLADINVPSNTCDNISYYKVKAGTTLMIEDCVRLYDLDI